MSLTLRKQASATGSSKSGAGGRANSLGYEVLLQEMLAKAGCDVSDPNPDIKRLACHMQLLQELHRNGAFGTLSGLMTMVLKEIVKSLYTDEVIADPLTVSGTGSSTNNAMARLPFFAALVIKESQLEEVVSQAEAIHHQVQGQAAVEEELRHQIRVLSERERSLNASVTRLEYEVAKSKNTVETTLEETELTRGKDQAAIKYLTEELNLARKEVNAAIAENKMLQAREDVEVRMRDHFSNDNPDQEDPRHSDVSSEVAVLIKQLLVLQNGRVDDFESRMAIAMAAAIPSAEHISNIKSLFAQEMNALHFEVKELYAHQESLENKDGNLLDSIAKEFGQASSDDDAGDENKDQGGYEAKPHPGAHAMWQVFHLAVDGDKHMINPMAPRMCTEVELHASVDRILRANYEAVCPYVKWQPDSSGPQPKGAKLYPEDHPLISLENAAEVAGRRAISASDYFYKHLQERYGCFQVAMLVGNSILKAVDIHQSTSSKIAMFGRIVGAQTDDAMWQYAVQCQWLMENHPRAPQWKVSKMANFDHFWKLLYPNQMESEIMAAAQEVQKGHHGFSNSVVLNYIISRLLTKTEPRLRRWMKVLKWKDTMNTNTVFRSDIVSIAPKLFPEVDTKVVDSAFCMAAQRYGGDSLPLESMAYLACHLEALTLAWPPGT